MQQLSRLAINDEGFIFDPATGESYVANETGLLMLRAIQAGKSDDAAAAELTQAYDVSTEDALHDLADFRSRLQALAVK